MIWPGKPSMLRTFVFRDQEDGGAGGGTPPTVPPAPPPAPAAKGAPENAGGDGKADEKITMTPAQLSERLDRAKGAERTALAKSLGFDTVEALQQALDAGKAALDAQKTDEERKAEAMKQAEDRIKVLETEATTARSQRDQTLIRAAAVEKLAGKVYDPGAAFKLLDLSQVKLDGETVTGIDDAIEAMVKLYPWTLADTKQKIAPRIGATNPDGTQAAPKESDDERRVRFFGGGNNGGFFTGAGVKPEVTKRPQPQ